jgi:GGDEF domain-containing protein
VVGAVIVFHDVSESRAAALKMAHLAQHDFLTGLPNRVLLTERLAQAMRMAQRHRIAIH